VYRGLVSGGLMAMLRKTNGQTEPGGKGGKEWQRYRVTRLAYESVVGVDRE